MIEETC